METVVYGVIGFTVVILACVAVLLIARSRLVASGNVKIEINDEEAEKIKTVQDAIKYITENQ